MIELPPPEAGASAGNGAPRSVAEALGQVVWLLSQSPIHRELPLKAIDTTFMPAIAHQQFRIFRFGPLKAFSDAPPESFAQLGLSREALEQLPLGVAIWAKLTPEGEKKVEQGLPLSPPEWIAGDRLWLLELISPYAGPDNKLSELMLADLMGGPFRGRSFNLHRVSPETGKRERIVVEPNRSA